MSIDIPEPSESDRRNLPDYLPARAINEFVYCPRLFFYEQVEGVFVESADTIEGSAQHSRVDQEGQSAPAPGEHGKDDEPGSHAGPVDDSDPHAAIDGGRVLGG